MSWMSLGAAVVAVQLLCTAKAALRMSGDVLLVPGGLRSTTDLAITCIRVLLIV